MRNATSAVGGSGRDPLFVESPRAGKFTLSQARLQELLATRRTFALPTAVRRFMENRFGADLRDVRIHTDGVASALCRALRSRAFAWGRHVVFATGQFRPDSRHGQQLIAHELAHVLQRRAAGILRDDDQVAVGGLDHPSELEADRIAARLFHERQPFSVTPDPSSCIRRAIQIDASTAHIVADNKGSVPGADMVALGRHPYLRLHLTRNAGRLTTPGRTAAHASAINLKATVDVKLDPKDNLLKTWEFGIIQLAKTTAHQWVYAGMTSSDGSMAFNFNVPPAWPKDLAYEYCVDSEAGMFPYAKAPAPKLSAIKGGVTVEVQFDDHPFMDAPMLLDNAKTGRKNLIWRMTRYFEAVSVFVARELSSGKIEPLAHASWHFKAQAKFKHEIRPGGRPNPWLVEREFPAPVVAKGPPNSDLTNKVVNFDRDPKRSYNALVEAAKKAVLTGGLATLVESDRWPPGVPSDFAKR